MSSFRATELFGGAIAVDLPSNFADVSTIRQVPDNQEVYLDTNGFTSVMFDILERVAEPDAATDEAALKFHFEDITSGSSETTRFWTSSVVFLSKMPNTPAFSLFATQEATQQQDSRKPTPDFTGIMLLLVRLEQHETDIVIMVNVPHTPGEYQKQDIDLSALKLGPLLEAGQNIRQKVMETFEVKDWSLFVSAEGGPE
ncbi:hypothetical protein LTS18_008203 [Coniosporium uncinatum]|uniref:Uncharacterized protein n=1 Tax=Coniosporium uncinatum TaxID=93489 RepID=A0ACC3D249_9PEZI|nr:hypothetical protein LTS18_008203 [Coniosporium uncinatum]